MPTKTRTAIFISGRGSNMMALVEAAKAPDFPAEFVLVVSNDPNAAGLAWAAERGIKTVAVDHKPYGKDREAHERAIDEALTAEGVEFICLAGYLRVLTPFLVDKWAGKMINIHPALLPAFKGLHTHERAIEAGATEHGATVHWVSSGVDVRRDHRPGARTGPGFRHRRRLGRPRPGRRAQALPGGRAADTLRKELKGATHGGVRNYAPGRSRSTSRPRCVGRPATRKIRYHSTSLRAASSTSLS